MEVFVLWIGILIVLVCSLHLYPSRLDHKFRMIWLKSPQSSKAQTKQLKLQMTKFQRKCHTLGTTLLTPCSNRVNARSTSWKHDAAIGGILRGTLEHNTALTVCTHFHYSEKHNRDTTSCAKSYGTKVNLYQLSQNKKCTSVVRGEILYLWIPLREEMSLSSLRLVGRVVTPSNK